MAFSNSANGICHSIADKVGAAFKLTHGRANAIALPLTIQFNRRVAEDRFAEIAVAVGIGGKDRSRSVDEFVQKVRALQKELRVPAGYRQAGIPENKYLSRIDEFAEKTLTFGPTLVNPRKPNLEEMKKLYLACYEGGDAWI
jgi:alcohol dehydrogenase class IV